MSEYNKIIKENDNLYRDAAKGMLCGMCLLDSLYLAHKRQHILTVKFVRHYISQANC